MHLNPGAALSVSLSRAPAYPVWHAVPTLRSGREGVLQRHGMPRSIGEGDDHVKGCCVHLVANHAGNV